MGQWIGALEGGFTSHRGAGLVFLHFTKERSMTTNLHLFMFRSRKNDSLNAFAPDSAGERLPKKFAPWISVGVIRPDQTPPPGLGRAAIEAGIAENGYQLWRKKIPSTANSP
jgi:hypothetical protein